MNLKLITLFIIIFSFGSFGTVMSQDLLDELPTTKEAFIASEKKVLATIDWLEKTSFDDESNKRAKQKVLLLSWLTNSPTVTVEVNSNILIFTKKNPDLLLTFMGGWIRYCLQNNYSKDKIQGNLAGIKAAINVYNNQTLKKDKGMLKLIELDNKGELENWVKENLEKK